MKDMTDEEFDIALHAGLGRCVQFLERCEHKEPYREAVLMACLNDYEYDMQTAGSRAWYIYRLLSQYNDDDFFFSRIKRQLQEVLSWKGKAWEFEHLFDLVFQFAVNGHAAAKTFTEKLYKVLLESLSTTLPDSRFVDYGLQWLEHICIEGMNVGGMDAVVKIAADLGGLFRSNSEYNALSFDQYVELCDDRFGRKNIRSTLSNTDDPDGNITAYIYSVEQYIMYVEPPETDKLKSFIVKMREKRENDMTCDVNKIMRDIEQYDNTEKNGKWHGVASEIANNVNTVFPIEAYMYVYTGLCAFCRYRVVRAMHKYGLLSDELLSECEFDCNEDTRKWAKGIKN